MNHQKSEEALIGSLMLDPSQIDRIGSDLSAADFADDQLGKLFAVMQDFHDAGKPAGDTVLLKPAARKIFGESSEQILAELFTKVPHPDHAHYYAEHIRDASRRRKFDNVGAEIRDRCSRGEDSKEIAKYVEAILPTIDNGSQTRPTTAYDAAVGLISELGETSSRRRPVRTGIDRVDRIAGGLMPGELEIIAARPGNGKTSLAMQVAMFTAEQDRPVLVVSLEMTASELVGRVLCGATGVASSQVRQRGVDPNQFNNALLELKELPLTIFDPPTATMRQIRAVAKMQSAAGGLELLVIDYIGLVQPRDRRLQRTEQVAEITAAMKQLAKEIDVPVIALCQLNRQADGATPILSHLRESGAIEQDADVVVFLHREDETNFKLIIAKHRHGDTGEIPVAFDGAKTRFSDSTIP